MRYQLLLAAGVVVGALTGAPSLAADNDTPVNNTPMVEQGQYIARAADCMVCHVGPDGTPFAGGKPVSTPLGDIIAPNISSSKKYGIGDYSVDDLARVLRNGKTSWFTYLYPAMPYPAYQGMTDEDIKSLHAYLQTVPAVEREPEAETNLDFPFNIRLSMIVWNTMNLDENHPREELDDQATRGRYIVDNLAHCGTCHTPRNDMMGSDYEHYLGGGQLRSWYAPNITSDSTAGIGAWSNNELADYFKNGQAGYFAQAAGPMGEAVHHSLKYLTEDDRLAMAAYLKMVPAIANEEQEQSVMDSEINAQLIGLDPVVTKATRYAPDELASHGLKASGIDEEPGSPAALYAQNCAACHRDDGYGQPVSYYASLNGNTTLRAANPRNLVAVLLNGVAFNGATPRPLMPGFEGKLDNQQIAALANYVRTEFGGHSASNVDADQVAYVASGKQPVSDLIRYAPLLAWLGVLIAVLLIVGGIGFWWRRRRQHTQNAYGHDTNSKGQAHP